MRNKTLPLYGRKKNFSFERSFKYFFFLSNVNLSDYNKICKLINYCAPKGPPSLPFFLDFESGIHPFKSIYI